MGKFPDLPEPLPGKTRWSAVQAALVPHEIKMIRHWYSPPFLD